MIETQAQYDCAKAYAALFERNAEQLAAVALPSELAPELRSLLVETGRAVARRIRVMISEYEDRVGTEVS